MHQMTWAQVWNSKQQKRVGLDSCIIRWLQPVKLTWISQVAQQLPCSTPGKRVLGVVRQGGCCGRGVQNGQCASIPAGYRGVASAVLLILYLVQLVTSLMQVFVRIPMPKKLWLYSG